MYAFAHAFAVLAPLMLMRAHLRLIFVNLTTNEAINLKRYTHFWTPQQQYCMRTPLAKDLAQLENIPRRGTRTRVLGPRRSGYCGHEDALA